MVWQNSRASLGPSWAMKIIRCIATTMQQVHYAALLYNQVAWFKHVVSWLCNAMSMLGYIIYLYLASLAIIIQNYNNNV